MTNVVAIVVLAGGFAVAAAVTAAVDRRWQLGLANPAIAWLVLTAIFFGIGSFAIAVDGRPGPAAFTGAAVAAFSLGLFGSDRLASRRAIEPAAATAASSPDRTRLGAVALLAAIAIGAVAPTLLRTGLPFLVNDITGARAELAGLAVQLIRVALPGAAAVALVGALHSTERRTVRLAAAAIVAVGVFELLLASRYLLAELAATLGLVVLLSGRTIPARVVGAVVVVGLILFAGIQLLRAVDQAQGREGAFVVERTVNRIVLIQPRTLDALMTVIPAEHDYFRGLTWVRRLAAAIGRDDVPNLGYWIYPRVVGDPQATAGYAAPGWLGEAWANLGWAGLVLFALLGAAVERLGSLIATRRIRPGGPSTADLAAGAMAVLFLARTHALGVVGLAVLMALVVAWRLLAAPLDGLATDVRRTLAWRT